MFAGGSGVPDDLEADLVSLVIQEHVIELDGAAKVLGVPPEVALQYARSASVHCLVLEGPPAVLLDIAGVPLDTGALA